MNVILTDCEEYRTVKFNPRIHMPNTGPISEKRILGFILLRGQHIQTISVEGPPPFDVNNPNVPLPFTCDDSGSNQTYMGGFMDSVSKQGNVF